MRESLTGLEGEEVEKLKPFAVCQHANGSPSPKVNLSEMDNERIQHVTRQALIHNFYSHERKC